MTDVIVTVERREPAEHRGQRDAEGRALDERQREGCVAATPTSISASRRSSRTSAPARRNHIRSIHENEARLTRFDPRALDRVARRSRRRSPAAPALPDAASEAAKAEAKTHFEKGLPSPSTRGVGRGARRVPLVARALCDALGDEQRGGDRKLKKLQRYETKRSTCSSPSCATFRTSRRRSGQAAQRADRGAPRGLRRHHRDHRRASPARPSSSAAKRAANTRRSRRSASPPAPTSSAW